MYKCIFGSAAKKTLEVLLVVNQKYKTIKDLPEDLRLALFGEPYDRIHKKKMPFSFGYAHYDFAVSIFVFCCISKLLTGDIYGKDFYFAPLNIGVAVYLLSRTRHRLDFKKKHEEWDQYCQDYLDRLNLEKK